jgi:repressor of nif and glnA expression
MRLVNQLSNINQFEIIGKGCNLFQSYDSLVALKSLGQVYLTDKWDYSTTTLKYLKIFLGITLSKKDIQQLIETGVYKIIEEETMQELFLTTAWSNL